MCSVLVVLVLEGTGYFIVFVRSIPFLCRLIKAQEYKHFNFFKCYKISFYENREFSLVGFCGIPAVVRKREIGCIYRAKEVMKVLAHQAKLSLDGLLLS